MPHSFQSRRAMRRRSGLFPASQSASISACSNGNSFSCSSVHCSGTLHFLIVSTLLFSLTTNPAQTNRFQRAQSHGKSDLRAHLRISAGMARLTWPRLPVWRWTLPTFPYNDKVEKIHWKRILDISSLSTKCCEKTFLLSIGKLVQWH